MGVDHVNVTWPLRGNTHTHDLEKNKKFSLNFGKCWMGVVVFMLNCNGQNYWKILKHLLCGIFPPIPFDEDLFSFLSFQFFFLWPSKSINYL